MKRELKFRCWSNERKEFVEWYNTDPMIQCSTGDVYCWERTTKPDGTPGADDLVSGLTEVILQQFTGLKDKNGTDIYEGDILHEKMTDETAAQGGESSLNVVRFVSGSFMVECEPLWNYTYSATPDTVEDFEVVGNIFENPELLK